MGVLQVLAIIVWFLAIPFCLGLPIAGKMKNRGKSIGMVFICGYFLEMAIFQFLYVFFVCFYNHFTPLVYTYGIFIALLSLLCAIRYRKFVSRLFRGIKIEISWNSLLWVLVILLVGFQLYKTFFYQFVDGDDAFYAAISVITDRLDAMYLHLPYTGETSELDVRHAFSGAPIFVAFLGRVCNLHPTIIHHSVFPLFLIVLSYLIYEKIAEMLLGKKKEYIPLFLIFINLLQIFGGDSIYTTATFMLTRTAQGKAILSGVVIPAAFLGIFLWIRSLKGEKDTKMAILFLNLVMLVAGFTTMLGIAIVPMITGVVILLFVLQQKQIRPLLEYAFTLAPTFILAVIYLLVVGR